MDKQWNSKEQQAEKVPGPYSGTDIGTGLGVQSGAKGYVGAYASGAATIATQGPGARWLIANRIRHLREEIASLEALSAALPQEIPHGAEAALCRLLEVR